MLSNTADTKPSASALAAEGGGSVSETTTTTDAAGRTGPNFTELGAGEIGGLTLVSRILGFAREMVFARIMGAGMAAGMRGTDIEDFARSVLGRKGEVLSRLWRSRPQSFAEMMQGVVEVESAVGKGSTFRLSLPPLQSATLENATAAVALREFQHTA